MAAGWGGFDTVLEADELACVLIGIDCQSKYYSGL